jgi:hypothetical protein
MKDQKLRKPPQEENNAQPHPNGGLLEPVDFGYIKWAVRHPNGWCTYHHTKEEALLVKLPGFINDHL